MRRDDGARVAVRLGPLPSPLEVWPPASRAPPHLGHRSLLTNLGESQWQCVAETGGAAAEMKILYLNASTVLRGVSTFGWRRSVPR